MKLPVFISLAMAMSTVAQEAPKTLLPLPLFHESWSEEDRAIVVRFTEALEEHLKTMKLHESDIPIVASYLHAVVSSGVCKDSFDDGDTLARLAAMLDDAEAMSLFLKKGENVNAVLNASDDEFLIPVSLASEVIWAKNLISTELSAAQRVEQMQALQSMGWDPQLHAQSVIYAMTILAVEHQDVSPLFEWFFSLNYELTQEQEASLYWALLVADGCTPIVRRFVEEGKIELNQPIGDKGLLPLQRVCSEPFFEKQINLDTLEYLLSAGADPNLMLADEDSTDGNVEYDPDGYEEDDLPRDDMAGYSTPIELVFDHYRSELSEGNHAREKNYLAAIDLLLLYGAELDIEEDECGDEEAESSAYAEVRKRLEMTPEQLNADFEKLTN